MVARKKSKLAKAKVKAKTKKAKTKSSARKVKRSKSASRKASSKPAAKTKRKAATRSKAKKAKSKPKTPAKSKPKAPATTPPQSAGSMPQSATPAPSNPQASAPSGFEVVGTNANAPFTLKLHRGDGMTLIAMNWKNGQPPQDFVGFAIEYQEPGGSQFFALNNRLGFLDADGNVNPATLSTLQSPIQKFRWVHFPRNADLAG